LAEQTQENVLKGALSFALLVSLGFALLPGDTHFCEDLEIGKKCDRLSGTGLTCYPNAENRKGAKYCLSGWQEITKEPALDVRIGTPPAPSGGDWICDNHGCVAA